MEGDGAWWWVFWLVKMVLRSEGGGNVARKSVLTRKTPSKFKT